MDFEHIAIGITVIAFCLIIYGLGRVIEDFIDNSYHSRDTKYAIAIFLALCFCAWFGIIDDEKFLSVHNFIDKADLFNWFGK